MACFALLLTLVCVAVSGAPPAPPRLYHHPAQLQQINPLDYYLDHPELHNYYNQQQQKQGVEAANSNQAARLETLEPDSEVELIPGAQTPQQPPQQTPVSPNLPGLLPGQRVFIVHMPVPGYRPGTIGGYQPVYIVAAAPQGNTGYPGSVPGYQSAVLVDPSQQVPQLYPRGVQGEHPGLVLASPQYVNRPYGLLYQEPGVGFHPAGAAQLQLQAPEGRTDGQGPVRLAQLIKLQSPPEQANRPHPAEVSAAAKQPSEAITESKEGSEEPRMNRPTSAHAQARTIA